MGLTIAAFTACTLTVSNVIPIAPAAVAAKIHHAIPLRYSYPNNHWCIPYHDSGIAIANATPTNTTKSFDNIPQRPNTPAPSTFRTPISFVRCSAI